MKHDIITRGLRKDIGEALWQARREKKILVSKVADDIQEKQRNIDLVEMGRVFEYRIVRKLARYYGKNIKIIFE